jgi:flagellar hook-associated protein 1 FlgK
MNNQIASIQSSSLQPPNDLLDQRDLVVSEMNQLAGVTVVKDASTGDYNVYLGHGFQLVGATGVNLISASASLYDPHRIEVFGASGSVQLSGNSMIGGQLGGLLDYRTQSLDLAQNSLGRIAITMADSVNALHTTGRDLAGNLGGVFFDNPDASAQAYSSSSNTGGAVVTATVTNANQLTTSDYQLTFSAGLYTLSRLSDGTNWSSAVFGTLATTAAQGFSLSISAAPNAGDTFLIRPTVAAANNVGVSIADPSLIAAAGNTAVAGSTLDNRNALAIAALQNDRTVVLGNNTLESSYTILVGNIGNKTDEIKVTQKSQKNLLDQARQSQQSESGVNLDEEAANLIRYQQAYQAAAKLISTASTMFDTLLQI